MSRRPFTVADHAAWRDSLAPAPEEIEHDDIDREVAESPPAQRPKREVRRLLDILDQLDKEGRLA